MRLALFQPDMPGNLGTILRLGACLDVGIDIIEPCGFPFSDRALKRAGMDYLDQSDFERHSDWHTFRAARPQRLILFSTLGALPYTEACFQPDDILLLGSESTGAPKFVHEAADLILRIPLRQGTRSLNVAVTAGIVLAEALRQTKGFPDDRS